MTDPLAIDWTQVIYLGAAVFGTGLLITLLLLGWILWRIRRIQLPPGADFMTALRATPFIVVVMLDLLDFSLDFLSAPFAWTILTYLGLQPLRGVSAVEGLIPGTQVLPTMTLAWIFARLSDPDRKR